MRRLPRKTSALATKRRTTSSAPNRHNAHTPPAAESPAHLKVLCFMLLGFGLVLLSMFFFSVARGGRTLIARCTVVAVSSCSFLFRPRPTHHASAHLRSQRSATRTPSAQSTWCRSRPPRGVTVFAERQDQTGAAMPQKQRRHFPPSHRLWVRSSHPHVSPAHAPSRRLQRVSF